MRFSTFVAALAPIMAVSAQTTWTVLVGANNSLTYTPSFINATTGDTVAFQFQSKNHTITQSTFAAPCQNMTTPTQGIDSGFMPVTPGGQVPQYSFTLTNLTGPLWFYCRQQGHCAAGMVFAINPTAEKSFDAFQKAANSTSTSSGSSSASSAGTSPTGAGTSSSAGSSPTTSGTAPKASGNGAMRLGGSAAGLLTAVGLAAGLML